MWKSLLSSFKNDFNKTISVYAEVETQNDIWEVAKTWPTVTTTGIKCLLLLNNQRYDAFVENKVEYIKTTHQVRLELWPTINIWDKIKDEDNLWYDVKFTNKAPWFGGVDDHLLLLVDVIIK